MSSELVYLQDTNTIMYLMKGDETVLRLIDQQQVSISFITEIELLGWPFMTPELERTIKNLIETVQYFDYSSRIKQGTVRLKQQYNLKIADAFIAATALQYHLALISADKVFSRVEELSFVNFIPTV